MADLHAFDMGRFQRLVGNEGEHVRGMWRTLNLKRDGEDETLVWPVDVVVWEQNGGWGFKPDDFSARVKDGVVDLDPRRVSNENRRAVLEDHLDEFKAVILAVALAAAYQDTDPSKADSRASLRAEVERLAAVSATPNRDVSEEDFVWYAEHPLHEFTVPALEQHAAWLGQRA